MTGPTSNTVTTLAGFSTLLTFMSHDMSPWVFVVGGLAFELGVISRSAAKLVQKIDGTVAISSGDVVRPIAICAVMVPIAASASCIVFLAAALSNVGSDPAAIGGCWGALLLLGLRGLEGFEWLASVSNSIFSKFPFPGGKSGGEAP